LFFSRDRDNHLASNFLAARIGAFEASLCYAKIEPAALHRGEIDRRRREDIEAIGRKPEFELSDLPAVIAGGAALAPASASDGSKLSKAARGLSRSNRHSAA
jgi:hypothetical protein